MSVSSSDWDVLVTEYKAVKKQLRSKNEALQLLHQQVVLLQEDCAKYRALAEQPVQRGFRSSPTLPASAKRPGKSARPNHASAGMQGESPPEGVDDFKSATSLEDQLGKLTIQHNEVVQERRVLHNRLERLEAANKEKGVATLIAERDRALKERNGLVEQLEQARCNVGELQIDMDNCREQLEEADREKVFFSDKCDRLNKQLLRYIQEHRSSPDSGSREFVDIDALQVENRYLKERLAKSGEEKQELIETVSKRKQRGPRFKQAIRSAAIPRSHGVSTSSGAEEQRPASSGRSTPGGSGSGGPVRSSAVNSIGSKSTTVHKVYQLRSTIGDLQAMVTTLKDSLRDKSLALQHSKSVNRTLAQRLFTLEQKLGCAGSDMGHPSGVDDGPEVRHAQCQMVGAGEMCSVDTSHAASHPSDVPGIHRTALVGSGHDNGLDVDGGGSSSSGSSQKPGRVYRHESSASDMDHSDEDVEWQRSQPEADQSLTDPDPMIPTDSDSSTGSPSWLGADPASKPLLDAPTPVAGIDQEFTTRQSESTEKTRLLSGEGSPPLNYGGAGGHSEGFLSADP